MEQSYDDYKRGRNGPNSYNNARSNMAPPYPPQALDPHSQQQQPIAQQPQSYGMNSVIMNPMQLQVAPHVTMQYGRKPQNVTCPYCNAVVQTSVGSKATTKTHLSALLLCCLCPCGCCFFPYCMDSCQRQEHNCPNCDAFLGANQN